MGDITLVPTPSWSDFGKLLENPTPEMLAGHCRVSEHLTWKHLAQIRAQCEIEFTLDDCSRRMRGSMMLHEFRQQLSAHHLGGGRVSSWTPHQFAQARAAMATKWPHDAAHSELVYSEISDRDLLDRDRLDAYSDAYTDSSEASVSMAAATASNGAIMVPTLPLAALKHVRSLNSMAANAFGAAAMAADASSSSSTAALASVDASPRTAFAPSPQRSSLDAALLKMNRMPASALPTFAVEQQAALLQSPLLQAASASQTNSGGSTPGGTPRRLSVGAAGESSPLLQTAITDEQVRGCGGLFLFSISLPGCAMTVVFPFFSNFAI